VVNDGDFAYVPCGGFMEMNKKTGKRMLRMIAFAISLLVLVGVSIAKATPARVLIIRHAEKPDDDSNPELSPEGVARAQALTQLFSIHPEYVNKGLPVAYFAAKYVPGQTADRAVKTITPLATAYKQPVLTPYVNDDEKQLAHLILTSPDYDGKTVMIAWTHGELPQLAADLGAQDAPDKWKKKIFDRVWILDYAPSGQVEFSDSPESVVPGDSD
jgi:hypothetical protein